MKSISSRWLFAVAGLATFAWASASAAQPAAGEPSDGGEPAGRALAEGPGLAAKYPGDRGLADDQRVVFAENFEQESLDAVQKRWESVSAAERMELTDDTPAAIDLMAGRAFRLGAVEERLASGRVPGEGGWRAGPGWSRRAVGPLEGSDVRDRLPDLGVCQLGIAAHLRIRNAVPDAPEQIGVLIAPCESNRRVERRPAALPVAHGTKTMAGLAGGVEHALPFGGSRWIAGERIDDRVGLWRLLRHDDRNGQHDRSNDEQGKATLHWRDLNKLQRLFV